MYAGPKITNIRERTELFRLTRVWLVKIKIKEVVYQYSGAADPEGGGGVPTGQYELKRFIFAQI